jgi:hypothetical protein
MWFKKVCEMMFSHVHIPVPHNQELIPRGDPFVDRFPEIGEEALAWIWIGCPLRIVESIEVGHVL